MSALPSPTTTALKNICVLVTRPAHQAQQLSEMIAAQSGSVVLFPVLEITESVDNSGLLSIIERLDEFDIAIFISPNAVNHALSVILAQRPLPLQLKLATVGQRTAKELEQFGLCADICPGEKFNSEALLALPEMQDVRGKHIVIFRGESGREFLAETLKQRGAEVSYAEVYRRTKPAGDTGILLDALERREIDIISVTSNQGLRNLFDMAGTQGQQRLRRIPLVVISERMVALASELGFKHIPTVSSEASDEALLKAITSAAQGVIKNV